MKNKGFTLIEMTVAIGILGVMAVTAIAVLNPFAQFQKADDAKRKADLSQIQKALESYYQDYQRYPAQINSGDYRINDSKLGLIDWGKSWGLYMNILPKDSVLANHYVYYSPDTNGQTYYIYASLNKAGSGTCTSSTFCGTGNYCGGTCNYGVSSPNVTP
jgi:prepilin-type N-terminal cleavage/methylation domain-containing protein